MSYDEYEDYIIEDEEDDLDAMLVMGMLDDEETRGYSGGGCLTTALLFVSVPTIIAVAVFCFC